MLKVASRPQKKHKFIVLNFFSRRRIIKFSFIMLLIVVLFILAMVYFITPIIVKTGQSKINELSNKTMNSAIGDVMQGSVSYDDLIHIVTDSDGKISMLQANSIQINALSRKVIDYTYSLLFEKLSDPLAIPFGSFTGIPAFATWGPVVNIDIIPFGNVYCSFSSKFISAGINQTLHKIYLHIKTDVTVVLPLAKLNSVNETEALICESLIIGEIPETYLVAKEVSDLLNVI